MVDLSIIIVNHNGQHFLEECVGSVYQSTHRASFEIIFVDNGSTDDSVKLVSAKFPQVKIIRNSANLGFCRANNQGLAVYQGKFALLLNTDTVTHEGALDLLVEFMAKTPKAGACGPKLVNTDGTPQHQGGLFANKFWLADQPVKVSFVIGAALLIRREVIERIGLLDDNFFFANDDLDWCLRVRKAGWDVYFVPDATVVHFGGFTVKKFNRRLFVEGFRGGLYFSKKHYGTLVYLLYRCLIIILMPLAIFFSLLFYPLLKNKERLPAYGDILLIALKGEITPKYEKNTVYN